MSIALLICMHSLLLCGFKVVPVQFFNCDYSIVAFDNVKDLNAFDPSMAKNATIVVREGRLSEKMLLRINSLRSKFENAAVIVMSPMGSVGFSNSDQYRESLFFYSEDDIGGVKALIIKMRENSITFKRRHVRAPVEIKASLVTETIINPEREEKISSAPNKATVCDLSISGAGVLVDGHSFEANQPIKLVLLLGVRDRKEFSGHIRWIHKVNPGQFRLGLEFSEAA